MTTCETVPQCNDSLKVPFTWVWKYKKQRQKNNEINGKKKQNNVRLIIYKN